MLLEMKCVFEAVYDESDFYYTHSYIQLYTQAKFALKILSHNFQVHILNISRVCVCVRERKGLREMFTYRKNQGVVKHTNFLFSPKLFFFFFFFLNFCFLLLLILFSDY